MALAAVWLPASTTPRANAAAPRAGGPLPGVTATTPAVGWPALFADSPAIAQLAAAEAALTRAVSTLLDQADGKADGFPVPDEQMQLLMSGPQLGAPLPALEQAAAPAAGLPTPAAQVAMHLAPLRKGPDGVHRLTIHLNPADLGTISVVAEVHNGAIAVQIHGATEAARAALHASLPELRRDLVEAGFGSCSLDLQQGGPGQGHRSWEQFGGQARQYAPRQPAPAIDPEPAAPVEGPTRAVDLRV
jgi:flagellar hook-length control protein FliK